MAERRYDLSRMLAEIQKDQELASKKGDKILSQGEIMDAVRRAKEQLKKGKADA